MIAFARGFGARLSSTGRCSMPGSLARARISGAHQAAVDERA